MLPYIFLLSCILVKSSDAVYSNKSIEGYRASYVSDCPGSMKPLVISRKMRHYLEIYVTGVKDPQFKLNRYSYHTVAKMAQDPGMDWSKKTIFYIPGWMDTIKFSTGIILTQYYRKKGYNIWILENLYLQIYEYPVAVRAIPTIGRHVAEMLANLTALQPKFSPKRLELIGLSMGGQTQSFIAKEYTKLTGLKLSKLTGLDPAGPCYRNRGPEGRIDASDADFVEIIHTNIDSLGMAAPVGHVDFYVNGGEMQPGDLYWMGCASYCSHVRSFTIWMAAMDHPDKFIAIKCDSVQDARNKACYDRKPMETNVMGPNVDKSKPGIYYLNTKGGFPYYLGEYGLKKENDYVMSQLKAMNAKDVIVY